MTSREILSKNLKRLVAESGKTQQQIGELAGLSKAMICRYISMARTPTLDNLDAIANFFGITASDLLREDFKK